MTDRTDGTDRWTERLSDYLDGELPATEAEAMERHLAGCEGCARTLQELRSVVARARGLEPSAPPRDLWPGIAARIAADQAPAAAPASGGSTEVGFSPAEGRRGGERRTQRLFTLSLGQLAAAAVTLVVLSGGVVWMAASGGGPEGPVAGVDDFASGATGARLAGTTDRMAPAWGSTLARYQAAIGELEQAIFYGGERLDTATVRRLQQSLRAIDRAIDDARRALREDPADP